jgi:LemA protein
MPMPIDWIVFAVLAAIGLYAIFVFNRLIRRGNMVREGWSGIDVQLKRRSDLIPNLVEVVKTYAAHERNLFEEIAKLRTSALAAGGVPGKAVAETQLQGSLGRLFALAEAYPELKANQNFLKLQEQLADLEDQLQMARRYYNGAVRDFNIGIQSFPDVLVARLTGFHEAEFFQADDAAKVVPTVALAGS